MEKYDLIDKELKIMRNCMIGIILISAIAMVICIHSGYYIVSIAISIACIYCEINMVVVMNKILEEQEELK